MKKTMKNIGLFAILSLVTVALSTSYIGEADASGPSSGAKAAGSEPVHKGKTAPTAQEVTPGVELSIVEVDQRGGASPAQTSYKGFNIEQYDTTQTFRAVYIVQNAGDGDVRNVKILVSSDTETIQETLQGNLDPKHSVISVMIKAVNPSSISADIVSFQVDN